MSAMTTCPRCDAPLPAGGSADECPRCLLAAGLESVPPGADAPGGAAAAAAAGGAAPRPAPTAPSPEEIGKHFPQLEVLELLGQGGMGIVYKARQRTLDRMVALKVLPPDVAREPGFAERFTREARTLARLQHPNIVGVHDFGESDGLYYLLMEYVDGANLREAMRAGGLRPAQALAIVPQICDALQYAHENGVVHRDVKPENILLDRAGRVRIADFGLAKIVQRSPVDVTLTRAGQVMGTLHYMAPEQYRTPDSVDHRADIYSLGVVLYEMLTGELPLGSFPAPSERSGVDVRIDRVVLRALESERDRRWQHASDMKTRVSEIAAGPDAPPPPRTAAAAAGGPEKVVELPGIKVTKGPDGSRVEISGALAAAGGGAVVVSRPSRLATVGGLGVPLAILAGVVTWLAVRTIRAPDDATYAGAIVAMAGLVAGLVVSLVAWVRIRHSKGALTGTAWAVTGTFTALAFLCCGVPAMFVTSPGGLYVKEGPEGTRVQMPGIDIEETKDGTRVRMPGIYVEETKDGRTRVRVSGIAVTAEDEAHAVHVTGGPESLDDDDRAALVATMRLLWNADAERVVRALGSDRTIPTPSDFRFFHLALSKDGTSGRLVLTTDSRSVAVTVARDGDAWTLGESLWSRDGAAGDADRGGDIPR